MKHINTKYNMSKKHNNLDLMIKEALGVPNFLAQTVLITKEMHDSGDCQEYIPFYTSIAKALYEGEDVSEEEKIYWLGMHTLLIKLINNKTRTGSY